MKNRLLSLLMSSTLVLSALSMAPRQAQAGVIIGAGFIADASLEPGRIWHFTGRSVAAIGAVVIVLGISQLGHFDPVALILDADGSLSTDSLAEAFSAKYPFIDNTDVTHHIAATINAKFKDQYEAGDKNVFVSLTPDETHAALAPAGLTPEQEQKVTNDLK